MTPAYVVPLVAAIAVIGQGVVVWMMLRWVEGQASRQAHNIAMVVDDVTGHDRDMVRMLTTPTDDAITGRGGVVAAPVQGADDATHAAQTWRDGDGTVPWFLQHPTAVGVDPTDTDGELREPISLDDRNRAAFIGDQGEGWTGDASDFLDYVRQQGAEREGVQGQGGMVGTPDLSGEVYEDE